MANRKLPIRAVDELTSEAESLGMYNEERILTEFVLKGVTVEVVGADEETNILVLRLAIQGAIPARRILHVDPETFAACPVGTRFRLVKE